MPTEITPVTGLEEPDSRRGIPRIRVRVVVGVFVCLASTAAMGVGLWHLLETGTCASGGPYVSARPCPDDIGLWILSLFGSVFGLLIGMALMGRVLVPWAIFFTGVGGTLTAAALTADLGPGGSSAAWSVGPMFLLMGVVPGVWAFVTWLRERNEPPAPTGAWLPVAGGWVGQASQRR